MDMLKEIERIEALAKVESDRLSKVINDAQAAHEEQLRKAAEASKIAQEAVKAKSEDIATMPLVMSTVKVTQEEFKEMYPVDREVFTKAPVLKNIPSAEMLVLDIAEKYKVTLEQSLEWLQTWDFNKVKLAKEA